MKQDTPQVRIAFGTVYPNNQQETVSAMPVAQITQNRDTRNLSTMNHNQDTRKLSPMNHHQDHHKPENQIPIPNCHDFRHITTNQSSVSYTTTNQQSTPFTTINQPSPSYLTANQTSSLSLQQPSQFFHQTSMLHPHTQPPHAVMPSDVYPTNAVGFHPNSSSGNGIRITLASHHFENSIHPSQESNMSMLNTMFQANFGKA